MRRLAIAAAASLAVLVFAAPAQGAGRIVPVTLGQTAGDAVFATGHPNAPDNTIIQHLRSVIRGAQPNTTIMGTIFDISPGGAIEDALWEVYNQRLVTVHLISDKPRSETLSHPWPASGTSRFRFKHCDTACMARVNADSGGIVYMHSKFFLLNGVKRCDACAQIPVSWVGSANLDSDTGTEAWNDAVTWWNDPDVNWGLWTIWMDMWNGPYGDTFDYFTWMADNPHTIGNGVFYAPNSATWGIATPDLDLDTWEEQLKQLKGPLAGGAPDCRVTALHNKLTDERIVVARQFQRLAREGCIVRIVVNRTYSNPTNEIDPSWRRILCDETGGDLQIRAVTKLHHKTVFAQATTQGKGFNRVVWGGSHNLSRPALRGSDEIITRVDGSQSLYNAYVQQYQAALGSSVHECTA
jgi:hypothetical protein